jgi:hypothetical protein
MARDSAILNRSTVANLKRDWLIIFRIEALRGPLRLIRPCAAAPPQEHSLRRDTYASDSMPPCSASN